MLCVNVCVCVVVNWLMIVCDCCLWMCVIVEMLIVELYLMFLCVWC